MLVNSTNAQGFFPVLMDILGKLPPEHAHLQVHLCGLKRTVFSVSRALQECLPELLWDRAASSAFLKKCRTSEIIRISRPSHAMTSPEE